MPKHSYLILISLIFLLAAAGCAPQCTNEELDSFDIILLTPANGSVVNYANPPKFDWTHEESCVPSNYEFVLAAGGNSYMHYSVSGQESSYQYNYPLQPGSYYEWYVAPINADGSSGYFGYRGPDSERFSFTTDGMCSGAELIAPVASGPSYGEWLGEGMGPGPASVRIEWNYPGDCYPKGYHYQVATDPAFHNIITSGNTDWDHRFADIQVPRCARLYWRVQGRDGNITGPYSDSSRFTYASISSCFQNQQSIDAALIKGFVFDDYCKSTKPWIPEGVDIWPPCVFGEPYGVHADGNRNRGAYEHEVTGETVPFEAGIPNVKVELGAGPCPSTGLDEFHTMANGAYYFPVQSPGTYCVSIDMDKNPALDNGIWTRPLTNQRTTEYTISFNQGEDLKLEDFGWDNNNFLKIYFWVKLTSFCRGGDSIGHEKLAVVEKDTMLPIFRRNQAGTWFETIVDGIPCLISIESGEPGDGADGLEIFPPYPDPEPVEPEDTTGPVSVNCSQYTDVERCLNAGCYWTPPGVVPSKCVPK